MFLSFLFTASNCVDYYTNLTIPVEVSIAGFENTPSLIKKLSESASFYLSEKKFNKFSVSYDIRFRALPDSFLSTYEENVKKDSTPGLEERKQYKIRHNGNIPNIFANDKSQQKKGDSNSPEYFLYLLNAKETKNVDIYYEEGRENNDCFLLNMNAAFCHLDLIPESYEIALFRHISQFLDKIVMPDLPKDSFDNLNSIQFPIVSFGPKLKSINIENQIKRLLPEDLKSKCYVTVSQCSLYDYPLIAAGRYSDKDDDDSLLMNMIHKSPQALGPSFAEAFSSKDGEKIFPIFIFEEEELENHRIISDDTLSVVFSSYENVERYTLSAAAERILTTNTDFGGNHPMLPNGGTKDFSPLLADGLHRVMVLNDLQYALTVYDETVEELEEIKEMNLQWVNISHYKSLLSSILVYVNKTSKRFTKNELAKASTSSATARKRAELLKDEITKLQAKIDIFSRCCPIIKYVKKDIVKVSWVVYALSVLVVILAIIKFVQLYKRRKFGYAPAAFDF